MNRAEAYGRRRIARRLPPAPWRDRSGAVSSLKAIVFAALLCPALLGAAKLIIGPRPPNPITDTIVMLGDWTLYFLLASLAITPLRQAFAWPRLIVVRRMVGVAAFAYALAHFATFTVDKSFDLQRVVSEIVLRINYAVGAVGFILLALLAATSTDAMVKRIGGKRWQTLHRAAYLAAAAAVIHYFLQVKADLSQPLLIAGLAGWLLFYRLVLWTGGSAVASRPSSLFAITLTAAGATAVSESLYIAYKFGAPLDRLLLMQLDLMPPGPRPAAWILAAGIVVIGVAMLRRGLGKRANREDLRGAVRWSDVGSARAAKPTVSEQAGH